MGLPNITRDNYITLVAAVVQGTMSHTVNGSDTSAPYNASQVIKDAMQAVDTVLQENGSCVLVELLPSQIGI